MLDGKSILITGGTGSFGHRYVSTLLEKYNLKRLVIYSRDELKQYDMEIKFRDNSKYSTEIMRFFIGRSGAIALAKSTMRTEGILGTKISPPCIRSIFLNTKSTPSCNVIQKRVILSCVIGK